jgi:hypothetical protein
MTARRVNILKLARWIERKARRRVVLPDSLRTLKAMYLRARAAIPQARRRQGRALIAWRRDPQCRARWLAALRRGVQASVGARQLSLEEVLRRHVEPEPNSSCWLWTGSRSGGYPNLSRGRLAQRYIFEAFHGPIPPGRRLIHRCGLVACVSPTHLALETPLTALTFEELQARFISVDTRTGCWLWRGRVNEKGYGRLGNETAHRRMFLASGRQIPFGHHLDHLCRTRACTNPSHLEAVTQATNSRRVSARRRGRARWGLAQGEWDEAVEREDVVPEAVAEWQCACGAVNVVDRPCELCGTAVVAVASR